MNIKEAIDLLRQHSVWCKNEWYSSQQGADYKVRFDKAVDTLAVANDLLDALQACQEILNGLAQTAFIENRVELNKYAKMGIDTARTAINKTKGEQ